MIRLKKYDLSDLNRPCVISGKPSPGSVPANMSARLAKSLEIAEMAYGLDVVDRRKKFSFLSRFNGDWSQAMDLDCSNNEDDFIDRLQFL